MTRRGLLLTMTEPPAVMEEEFNVWYDEEHFPERLSIPGFRSARRWVAAAAGEGKYLATYELDSPAVLNSPEYLRHFDHPTPWTRRCLGRAVVFKRWACEQLVPGDADPHAAAGVLVVAFADVQVPGALQTRRFAAVSGETIVLVELADLPQARLPGVLVYRTYGP